MARVRSDSRDGGRPLSPHLPLGDRTPLSATATLPFDNIPLPVVDTTAAEIHLLQEMGASPIEADPRLPSSPLRKHSAFYEEYLNDGNDGPRRSDPQTVPAFELRPPPKSPGMRARAPPASAHSSATMAPVATVPSPSAEAVKPLLQHLHPAGVSTRTDDPTDDIMPDEDSPFDMVRAVVSNRDDPTLPTLTVRVWILGLSFLVILSVVNQFFWFRETPIGLGGVIVLLLSYPMGKFMAWSMPHRTVRLRPFPWSFELNPGPFSIKEHVLVSIVANSGAGTAYAIDVIVIKRLFYKTEMAFATSLLLLLTSQLVGYGLAGIARKFLVRPAAMIWPAGLITVALFRTFHDKEELPVAGTAARSSAETFSTTPTEDIEMTMVDENSPPLSPTDKPDGLLIPPRRFGSALRTSSSRFTPLALLRRLNRLTRVQYFWAFFMFSFVWYFVPGYLFTGLGAVSLLCLVAPTSLIAQQLGDGRYGLGILSFSMDWSMISSAYLSSPIATPFWTACNMFASFVVMMWVLVPLAYYFNVWDAAHFPIYSAATFDVFGNHYNTTRVMPGGSYDEAAYQTYSPLRLAFQFALTYGLSFASFASLLTYTALYHGKDIMARFRESRAMDDDIHAKLMRRYPEVPSWWYSAIFFVNGLAAIYLCERMGIGLPWWAVLLALGIAGLFLIPVGIIAAVSNQSPGLNVITEFIIGYLLPGQPIANVTFKTYGTIALNQGLALVGDMKLAHYMKIPPRHMFICQAVGTVCAGTLQLATAYYLMDTVPRMCDPDNLPWTCRGAHTFYSASIIWGLIGPLKMFGPGSPYYFALWFFLLGFLLPFPIYFLQKRYPNLHWLQFVHVPIILGALDSFPPGPALVYPMWFLACVFFNLWIYRRHNGWWKRLGFIFSVALDSGLAVAGLVIFVIFQSSGIELHWWGNDHQQCPLSRAPLVPASPFHS
ncbi:hypothetical protein IWQ60_000300 [Tieghemiomyces parasiticus]|uniref:Oligopeptide transporter n=1 Tax=Tieghemiomyces parasiticus TaxID=78921 RepID=A0A9W8E2W4_9FUNG|nr:hypothetical protein IWQ60_000300 [Tieghemiomyces parasiticus]